MNRPDPLAESIRVDKWLWAVRVFKTRTSATSACNAGRVKLNGEPAKPSSKLKIDDEVEARRGDRIYVYRVKSLIEKRVGAKLVGDCVEDLSPPEKMNKSDDALIAPPGGARERGQGRPTKKERRRIDRLRNRS